MSGVVTQNIDGLHQLAGSKNVLELHGSVHRKYCVACKRKYPLDVILESNGVPHCECGGIIRPDVVLYGEPLDQSVFRDAEKLIAQADVLLVAGTSLRVYPAAGLIDAYRGERLILVNRSETGRDRRANLRIYGNIGDAMRLL